jgi:hypothetical protein
MEFYTHSSYGSLLATFRELVMEPLSLSDSPPRSETGRFLDSAIRRVNKQGTGATALTTRAEARVKYSRIVRT